MVRIRKTKTSSGKVRFYCGRRRISEEKYEALCVNAKCRPKNRCRAITNENAQCKNSVTHRFAYLCKVHEKMNIPFVISDCPEDAAEGNDATKKSRCQKQQCEVILPNGKQCQNCIVGSSNKQCHVHESNCSESDVE